MVPGRQMNQSASLTHSLTHRQTGRQASENRSRFHYRLIFIMATWQVSKYLPNLAMIKDLRKWIYLLLESSE